MGYDQTFKINLEHKNEIFKFLRVLRKMANEYPSEFNIEYSFCKKTNEFYICFDGRRGVLDSLLTSLFINKFLYYYCLQSKNKIKTINILSKFITKIINYKECFGANTISSLNVKKFLSEIDFDLKKIIPTHNVILDNFEKIMRQWDVGSLSNEEFLVLLDGAIENFLRKEIFSERKIAFPQLLNIGENNEIINEETKKLFEEIHQFKNDINHGNHKLTNSQIKRVEDIIWGECITYNKQRTINKPLFSHIDEIDTKLLKNKIRVIYTP